MPTYAFVPVIPGEVREVYTGASLYPMNPAVLKMWYVAPAGTQAGYLYDGTNFTEATNGVSFSQLKINQTTSLSNACANAITSGFQSQALGSTYTYPSTATDQMNLAGSIISSLLPNLASNWATPFWCADVSGSWAMRNHSATQIQQVGVDCKTFVLTQQTKLRNLIAQVANATTAQAVQSIVWS